MKNYVNYQNHWWSYHENMKVEPLQLAQMNIYKSTTSRSNLDWLLSYEEPRFSEKQQMKNQKYPLLSNELGLRHWIPNSGVPCSKQLGGSKVDLAFHPYNVDKVSTRNF